MDTIKIILACICIHLLFIEGILVYYFTKIINKRR